LPDPLEPFVSEPAGPALSPEDRSAEECAACDCGRRVVEELSRAGLAPRPAELDAAENGEFAAAAAEEGDPRDMGTGDTGTGDTGAGDTGIGCNESRESAAMSGVPARPELL
jgi:hypothetical protein